ncbi:MAG: magnesium transporter CorA family protein [Candidatus Levybacteria bacterium]|nr:magnesium transporter CorA family protein [Candidatus Levybacteria bacterium]
MNAQTVNFNKFSFVDVTNPHELEIKDLKKNFGFNSLDLEDYIHRTQVPKIQEYPNYTLIVLDFPFFKQNGNGVNSNATNGNGNGNNEKGYRHSIAQLLNIPHAALSSLPIFHFTSVSARRILTSHVNLFIGKEYIVVLHEGVLTPINHIFSQCQKTLHNRDYFMGQGSVFLAYKIIDALVDNCFPIINELIVMIEKIDQELENKRTKTALEEISITRRNLVFFHTMIKPILPLFKHLEAGEYRTLNGNMTSYWSNVHDHLKKIGHRLEDSKELIEGISESNEFLLRSRTNEIMTVLTILFTLTVPATVIGTFYGMNVFLPGGIQTGSWNFFGPYTMFILVILGAILPVLPMLWYFKYRRWF